MSIRLIRQSSDTPNITNRDDTRMARFAYGGIDGVMQGFGSELSHAVSGSKFRLNSGRIVLQGWEVDVEGTGWELDLSTVVGTQYHLVYLEVNVGVESAVIKSTYLTGSIPSIDFGDDLTEHPEGTARLPLYSFIVTNGVISSVVRKFSFLSYYGPRFDSIEERLDRLGFREGSVDSIPFNTSEIKTNFLRRQGNYVIGGYTVEFSEDMTFEDLQALSSLGVIPKQFRPSESMSTVQASVMGTVAVGIYNPNGTWPQAQIMGYYTAFVSISKDTGEMSWYISPQLETSADLMVSQLQGMIIQFAYEAQPIE